MYVRTTTASRREAARASARYFHVSCEARMIENPLAVKFPGLIFPMIPFVEKGTTYKASRNATKRGVKRAIERVIESGFAVRSVYRKRLRKNSLAYVALGNA